VWGTAIRRGRKKNHQAGGSGGGAGKGTRLVKLRVTGSGGGGVALGGDLSTTDQPT